MKYLMVDPAWHLLLPIHCAPAPSAWVQLLIYNKNDVG